MTTDRLTTLLPAGETSLIILADSSGLVSLLNPTDSNHRRAVQAIEHWEHLQGTIIVPGDVFTETVNVIGKKLGHAVAKAAGRQMLESPTFVLAECSNMLRDAAFERIEALPFSVSLTDCVVMAFADQYEAIAIFGFDAVFARQGYQLPQ